MVSMDVNITAMRYSPLFVSYVDWILVCRRDLNNCVNNQDPSIRLSENNEDPLQLNGAYQ